VAIFVAAAMVTPSTDPIQQTVLAMPLIVLYEPAIMVAAWVEKRRERSDQAVLLALLALLPRRRTVPTWGAANLRL
jgi:Sec-independent protein secretion pathway component TatC